MNQRTIVALVACLAFAGCRNQQEDALTEYFTASPELAEQGWQFDGWQGADGRFAVRLNAPDVLTRPPAETTLLRICPDAELDNIWERARLEALALELWDGGEAPRLRVDCPQDFSRARLERRLAAAAAERRRRQDVQATPEEQKILRVSYRDFNLEGSVSYQGRWTRLQSGEGRWNEDSRVLQITLWPFRLTRADVKQVSTDRTLAGLEKPLPDGGFETMPHAVIAIRFATTGLHANDVTGITADLYGWDSEAEMLTFELDPRSAFQQLEMRDPELGTTVHLRFRGADKSRGMNVHAMGVMPLLAVD